MKPYHRLYLVTFLILAACGPVVIAPVTPASPTTPGLPDLIVTTVYLGMQGIPGRLNNCVPFYGPLEIRAIIQNGGASAAVGVVVGELSSGHQVQAGTLQALQSVEVVIPIISANSSYMISVDPQNTVIEQDENNNVYSYISPTPTPPVLCSPTPFTGDATPVQTFPPPTPVSSQPNLNGLVYANMDLAQIWKIDSSGQPVHLMDGTYAQFSPNGEFGVYELSGELWLTELMNKSSGNITNSVDWYDQFPQWWHANPSRIVFNAIGTLDAQEQPGDHEVAGYLSIVYTDGTGYATLADHPSYTQPALSPDGKTIAYDVLGTPMLYELDSGPRAFDTARFGFSIAPGIVFTSPSFSPDGRFLTWWISEDTSAAQKNFTLRVFDLTNNTYTGLHSYATQTGISGWLRAPSWSPSGSWLAFQTLDEATPRDLWAMHRDGGIGQRFGLATNPVWSADSQRLAFVQWPPHSDSYLAARTSVVDVPAWNIQQTSMPAGSIPLAWPAVP